MSVTKFSFGMLQSKVEIEGDWVHVSQNAAGKPEKVPIARLKGAAYFEELVGAAVVLEYADTAHCPKCRSDQLTTQKKGLSAGKALVGAIIAGPLGLFAGAHGKDAIQVTCLSCGEAWVAGRLGVSIPVPKSANSKKIAAEIHSAIAARVPADSQQAPPSQGGPSAADEITKLADLHSKGLLTDAEFAAAKKKALGL